MILVKIYNRYKKFTETLTADNFYINDETGVIRLYVSGTLQSVIYANYTLDTTQTGLIKLDITVSE